MCSWCFVRLCLDYPASKLFIFGQTKRAARVRASVSFVSRALFLETLSTGERARRRRLEWLVGTLSKDDDEGSENVAKKMNLRSFKHNRVYLDPLNLSNAGDFSWS